MGKWAEFAAKMDADAPALANTAISADREAASPSAMPFGPIGPNGQASLPRPILMGLEVLQAMPMPRISLPPVWPEIVADALRLRTEGWAAQAIGLGWNPLHLWGCSPEIGGNEDQVGLAVWIAGRRVLMLDERACIVGDGPRSYSVFNRRPMPGAVLLWELGGGSDGRGRGFGR